MKIQNLGKVTLGMAAFLWMASQDAFALDNLAINSVSLESISKVEHQHVPGVGANYSALVIEGRSGNRTMNVNISVNSPGWGGQKVMDACEKNARLVMHYPSRYVFEVVSEDTGQDGAVTLNVSDSNSDAVTCSVKVKSRIMDPGLPTTNLIKKVGPTDGGQ